jgi:hypothetical protein
LVRWLYREIRAVPGSITYPMPGTVSEVSATFVASTTRRLVCGSNTRCCSAADSRPYSGSTSRPAAAAAPSAPPSRPRCPDLPLAAEEDQDVAGPRGPQLGDRVDDALHLVARLGRGVVRVGQRPVADLHRVRPAGHLDHRRVAEVRGEPAGLDRGRGDDDLQVRSARQQPLDVAEQEVDVQAALVRLVDDQRVVPQQVTVPVQLGQQDPVGHQLDQGVLAGRVVNLTW